MRSIVAAIMVLLCASFTVSYGQNTAIRREIVPARSYVPPKIDQSYALQPILDSAIKEVVDAYPDKSFKYEEIAATLIDLRDPEHLVAASFNGETKIYPASVVKMFYMAALHQQLQDGKVKVTPELTRGLKDMIVDSSNEATQYILDVITNTSSGGEMPAKQFAMWAYKRNAANRYFGSMGYMNINVNQKTFCEDAYGIEQQFRNYKGENRNMLTTNATARLLAEIALGRMVTKERSAEMMALMKRDPFAPTQDNGDQAHGFTGKLLIDRKMNDAKLWSKAGWTSRALHDAAYVETGDGLKFVLVIFTEKHANDRETIPAIAGKIIDGLRKIKE